MRVINVVMCLVFVLCVVVQVNDPDPMFWVIVYGYSAVVTGMAAANRYTVLAAIGVPLYLVGVVYYMPGWNVDSILLLREAKMNSPEVELAREAFGLLICAAWMGVLAVVGHKRGRGPTGGEEAETE